MDQDVINLAKAIRQKESGNRAVIPAEGSKLGGASRYQYTHNTWKETARKYLGDPNAPLNLQNENKATYLKIKDWKDKGYNPAQIASMWNAGEGRPDAYKQNWKGTNKYGVSYDTPKYVKSVYDEYQKIKGSNPQSRQPAQPVVPTVAEQRQTLQAQGQPVARNPERVEPTFGGKIARDVLKTPARFLENIKAIPKLIQGQSYEDATTSDSKYFGGQIQGVGTKGGPTNLQNFGSQLKDTAGASLEMASYIPIAGAVGGTAKLAQQGVKLTAKQLATQTAKRLGLNAVEGAVGNTMFEAGKKLQGEPDRESLGKSALYGAGGGLAFGIGGRALTGVVRGARKTAVALGKGGVPEDLAVEATGKLKGAWSEYINDFKDLTSFRDKYKQKTGANIEDILTREVITPEIKGNKIDLTDSIAKNEAKIASSAENVKGLAKAFNDVPVQLADLEKTAIGVVNDTNSILSSGNINKARKGVTELFEGLREAYGDTINPEIANDIRVAMNRQTKAFKGSVGELFEQDIANAVGDAVRTKLDEVIQDDVFRRANAEVGELLNVRKFMQKVNGKNVGGGRFSQAFAGIVGSKILGGVNKLPMGVGDVLGYMGGKQLQKQANQYAFGKAGPRTRAILRRMENKSAIGAEVAEKTASRKQVLLPARTSPVNKAFGSGKPINLPKKAQSTLDAQEMANLSLQKIKKGDYIEVKGNEVEVTLKTDDGIVVKDGNGKREFISKENLAKGQGEQAFGAVAGLEVDEDGNVKFNKDKALMGVAGMAVAKKAGLIKGAKEVGETLIKGLKEQPIIENDKAIFYHTTYKRNADAILKEGFRKTGQDVGGGDGDLHFFRTRLKDMTYDFQEDFAKGLKDDDLIKKYNNDLEKLKKENNGKLPEDTFEILRVEIPKEKLKDFNFEYSGIDTDTDVLTDIDIPAKYVKKLTDINTKEIGDNLLQEAKKYKSAEEFVKAQGKPVYRGQVSGKNLSKQGRGSMFGNAPHISENINTAKQYGEVSEMYFSKNANIKKFPSEFDMVRQIQNEMEKLKGSEYRYNTETNKIIDDWAKINKVDAIISQDVNGAIFNPDVIKTKSQLTDIWNKANKTSSVKLEGVNPEDIVSVRKFGSSVEGKKNPNDVDHFVIVRDGSMKFSKRGGLPNPVIKTVGKNQYFIMPESDGEDLLQAMLYTGRKDSDRGYSGKTVDVTKDFKNQAGFVKSKTLNTIAGATLGATAISNIPKSKTTYTAPKENPLLKEKKLLTDEVLGKTLMQLESSGGKNKTNADKGEMKWLVGLTELAIKELKRLKKIPENFDKNNKEQVIKAGIEYFKLMQERNPEMTPAEVYVDKYWTQWKNLKNPKTKRAEKMIEFQNLISVEN